MNDRCAEQAVIEMLAVRFPKCFAVLECRRMPLAIGIRDELHAVLAGAVGSAELHAALRVYTTNERYLSRMLAGTWRIGLDGQPAGVVSRRSQAPSCGAGRSEGTAEGSRGFDCRCR
jgi:sRNA-binding protein